MDAAYLTLKSHLQQLSRAIRLGHDPKIIRELAVESQEVINRLEGKKSTLGPPIWIDPVENHKQNQYHSYEIGWVPPED